MNKLSKHPTDNKRIIDVNNNLKSLSVKNNVTYIDLHRLMIANDGELKSELSIDGLHLNGKGYQIWKDAIKDYL